MKCIFNQRLFSVECEIKERPGKKDIQGIERLRKFYGNDHEPQAFIASPIDASFDVEPGITAVSGWEPRPIEVP